MGIQAHLKACRETAAYLQIEDRKAGCNDLQIETVNPIRQSKRKPKCG